MENEIERFTGKVNKIKDNEVTIIVTEQKKQKLEGETSMRVFPKNLFDKNVQVDDEFIITTTGGSGWMQIDFEKIDKSKPQYSVMIDDDDSVSEDLLKEIVTDIADREFIKKCRDYAIAQHRRVNQLYDGKPYSFHLDMAVDFLHIFIDLIPKKDRANVIGGMYNHDTIEDTGITLNDLIKATNEKVGNIAYALTNEKGRNRHERANAKYYRGIRKEEYADIDKICDRAANIKHSYTKFKLNPKDAGMFKKYKSEHPKFVWGLIKPEWYEIHQHALRLLMGSRLYGRYRKSSYKYNVALMLLEDMLNQK